jgi:hypothetical protein
MNDHTAAAASTSDDSELVTALVHWAMSKGAIIRRDWLGLPPRTAGGEQARLDREPDPETGMILSAMTRGQATVALRRLGYQPGEIAAILSAARKNGQHLTARHLVSFHGNDENGKYVILPASRVTHYASAASGYEARWLREIRDIAGEVSVTDAEAGGRIRALLFPPHMHDDDGTVEGCPGCFPPGEATGSDPGPGQWDEMTADARVLEQAVRVLNRRFHESITQDQVTAGTAHAWVRYAARVLRNQAREAGQAMSRKDVHDHEEHRDGTVTGCPAGCPPDGEYYEENLGWGRIASHAAGPACLDREDAIRHLMSEAGGNYTATEAYNAADGAMAIEGGVYTRLAFHDVAYVIEDQPGGRHLGYLVTPKQVPDNWPGARETFYRMLDDASTRRPDDDLTWLLAVIPVVDQALDDLAPEVFRRDDDASRIANMYRRFAAGPVSEAAEAIDALNGMTGGNPRKGVTHSRADLLGEAADTAFSSLLAIQSQTKDIAATWVIFIEAAARAYSRVPDEHRPGASGEEAARGC